MIAMVWLISSRICDHDELLHDAVWATGGNAVTDALFAEATKANS